MPSVTPPIDPKRFVSALTKSGLTIYDEIEVGDPTLWIPTPELEWLLDEHMCGIDLSGFAIKTRSKVAKQHVCTALGYPIPNAFKKSQPRFPGQRFDTYVQKSNNLQVWNEELSATRRYVLIRVNSDGSISRVKVVAGDTIAELDHTGKLTQKYQARCIPGSEFSELIVARDTERLRSFVSPTFTPEGKMSPVFHPISGQLLPIMSIYNRLKPLIGRRFKAIGVDQERNRGAALHRMVCSELGYSEYRDNGQFPDLRHQLLEVKLQTAPTIDLGVVTPNSTEPLDVPQIEGCIIRYNDTRYAVFYAKIVGTTVELTHLFVTTGEAFFERFPQFQGKVLNKKLQIRLPSDFFDR